MRKIFLLTILGLSTVFAPEPTAFSPATAVPERSLSKPEELLLEAYKNELKFTFKRVDGKLLMKIVAGSDRGRIVYVYIHDDRRLPEHPDLYLHLDPWRGIRRRPQQIEEIQLPDRDLGDLVQADDPCEYVFTQRKEINGLLSYLASEDVQIEAYLTHLSASRAPEHTLLLIEHAIDRSDIAAMLLDFIRLPSPKVQSFVDSLRVACETDYYENLKFEFIDQDKREKTVRILRKIDQRNPILEAILQQQIEFEVVFETSADPKEDYSDDPIELLTSPEVDIKRMHVSHYMPGIGGSGKHVRVELPENLTPAYLRRLIYETDPYFTEEKMPEIKEAHIRRMRFMNQVRALQAKRALENKQ